MVSMIWGKHLSVGNLVIDAGHKDLMGIVNTLEYAIQQKDTSQMLRVLRKLYDSARLHFHDEEIILRAVSHPFVPHKLEHRQLLDELQDAMNSLNAAKKEPGKMPDLEHYPAVLRGWFLRHISEWSPALKPKLEKYPYDFMPV